MCPYLPARAPLIQVSSNFSLWDSLVCFLKNLVISHWFLISLISLHLIILAKGLCFPQTGRGRLSVSSYACRGEGVHPRPCTLSRRPTLKPARFLRGPCVPRLSCRTHCFPLRLTGITALFGLLLRKRQFLEEGNEIYHGASSLPVLLAHPACSDEGNVMKGFP